MNRDRHKPLIDEKMYRKLLTRAGLSPFVRERLAHHPKHWQAYSTYRIRVEKLAVTACFKRKLRSGLGDEWVCMQEDGQRRFYRQLQRVALRTVYALGFDQGWVELIWENERLHVLNYEALDSNLVQSMANDQPTEHQSASKLIIGMDPEFMLLGRDGKIVMASKFVGKSGRVGSDSLRVRDRLLYPIVELRPLPSSDPHVVMRRLQAALREATQVIDQSELVWLAGGMPVKGLSLGGHIHFSGVPFHAELIRALDNYVALSFIMVEGELTIKRRPKFGFLGDFRHKRHGGFEYRTLPSWLVAPMYAQAAVILCKLVGDNYGQLRLRPLAEDPVQAAYYAGDKEKLLSYVQACWQDLERLTDYSRWASVLQPFRKAVMASEDWPETSDIRLNWQMLHSAELLNMI